MFGVISMNGTTSDASQFIDALLFGVGMNLVPAVDAAYASLATLPAVPTDIQVCACYHVCACLWHASVTVRDIGSGGSLYGRRYHRGSSV